MKLKEKLEGNYPVPTALITMCIPHVTGDGYILVLCYFTDNWDLKVYGKDEILPTELSNASYDYVLNDNGGMVFIK